MQLSLLGTPKVIHICFENVQIKSKNITQNGLLWYEALKIITVMDSLNVNITFDPIWFRTCKYF